MKPQQKTPDGKRQWFRRFNAVSAACRANDLDDATRAELDSLVFDIVTQLDNASAGAMAAKDLALLRRWMARH